MEQLADYSSSVKRNFSINIIANGRWRSLNIARSGCQYFYDLTLPVDLPNHFDFATKGHENIAY